MINYRTEKISVASGGKALSLRKQGSNEVGIARFELDEIPGNFDIVVGTFDENDGLAQFALELNDVETNQVLDLGVVCIGSNSDAQYSIAITL